MKKINTIAIIGVGLIGGSIGKAVLKRKMATEVIGIGRNINRLKKALKQKTVTKISVNIEELKNADMVVLATPVVHIENSLGKIIPFLKKGCIVTDGGSTKSRIVKAAEKYGANGLCFVGSHPIAGSEKSGADHADPDLFKGNICVVTPVKGTDKKALMFIKKFWNRLGAKVLIMSPEKHDEIISLTSHLPHYIAAALTLAVLGSGSRKLPLIGKGFMDTTRIAASSPEMWRQVAESNKKNILRTLKIFMKHTGDMEKYIRAGRFDKFMQLLLKAKKLRESI